MLVKSGLDAGKEHFHGLFSLGVGRLACDIQQADNGIFKVVIFDGLLPLLLLLCMGGIALLMGSHHLLHTRGSPSAHPLNVPSRWWCLRSPYDWQQPAPPPARRSSPSPHG